MARQSPDPSPEARAPSGGGTLPPNDPGMSTWRSQLSILDFPVRVDFAACSWSRERNPYGRLAIAAKRATTQLQPNPRPRRQPAQHAAGGEANRRSRPDAFFAIAKFLRSVLPRSPL